MNARPGDLRIFPLRTEVGEDAKVWCVDQVLRTEMGKPISGITAQGEANFGSVKGQEIFSTSPCQLIDVVAALKRRGNSHFKSEEDALDYLLMVIKGEKS